MQQYFITDSLTVNKLVDLPKDVLHHFVSVLRMKKDEEFYLVDKNNVRYLCVLDNNQARVIKKEETYNELAIKVTIIQSLIKNDKFDLFLTKATELGVYKVVPLITSRTIVKSNDKIQNKLARWNKICFEASCQCKRNIVPNVTLPISIEDINDYKSDINLVCYENLTIKNKLKDYVKMNKSITIVIGPEGGFSDKEINYLNDQGFKSISLGKRILRAETASMYALSVIDGILD